MRRLGDITGRRGVHPQHATQHLDIYAADLDAATERAGVSARMP
jgi:hypothetical protein